MRIAKNTFSARALDYARQVTSGKIAACWQVRSACQRFIDDFERQDLRFRPDHVDHVCNFAQQMPHVIGPLSGELIKLEPFQIFIFANLFGWTDAKTGLRRYREAFILLPRGNAKSTIAAVIGNYMTFCLGQGGAEGLSGATSLKQANAVFTPARQMVLKSPEFAEFYGLEVNAKSIYQPSTGSSFQPVKAKTEDGGLPWCCIADEVHQALDDTQLNAFRTGMGKRRGGDPLLLIISTAGTNTAGVCRQEQLYFENVLKKTVIDDSKFALIYTIDDASDDWRDFKVWKKANPNYGVSIDEDRLKSEYRKALQTPSYQAIALTKYLNVWQNTGSGWLNSLDWGKAADPSLTIPHGARCWIGVDLSTRTDLTCLSILFKLPDGQWGIIPHIFVPSGALETSRNAKAYVEWIAAGAMVQTDGNASDFQNIEQTIRNLCKTYRVEAVLFDPCQAANMMQTLSMDGINCVEFAQKATVLNQPLMDFEADLLNGNIKHNDNPALNWMALNATLVMKGPFRKIEKPAGQNHLKIDGMVAAVMAYGQATVAPPPKAAPMLMFV